MGSDDELYYYGSDDGYGGNVSDSGFDDVDAFDPTDNYDKISYTILKEEDIHQRQEDDITRISSVLSVSRDSACMLLRHYKWSVNDVHEAWFDDEERVRKAVGLVDEPVVKFPKSRKVKCEICFDSHYLSKIKTAGCGHPFCIMCWRAYINTSISDGPGCLALKCPSPSCVAVVGVDLVNLLASEEEKQKYHRYLTRSYVEDNRKVKWCPAPGCNYAVEYDVGGGIYDVSCLCSYSFCWNCAEETHRPVDCDTVSKWVLKNNAESENTNWILANSKPCPKCKRPIEKNHGCMHMTCSPPCKFQFCWLCLGPWSDHGQRTGGNYACNQYESAKKTGQYDEAERQRKMAKISLEKYTHYYERWANNQVSRKRALACLDQMQTVNLEKISEKQCLPVTQLKFIIDAWQQIVECRRVLKWTYAYGYYLPEEQDGKKHFFEYLQGQAESGLERLHKCAEKELLPFVDEEPSQDDFNNFRVKLTDLTSITRSYFENLVRALENGLEDVDSKASTKRTISESLPASKGRARKKRKSSVAS